MDGGRNDLLIKKFEESNAVRVVDIPVDYKGVRPILGSISYTMLILTWGLSILIPIGLVYWLFYGNWTMVLLLLTVILVPIVFNWHDNVPGTVKYLSELLTRDIHHWTGKFICARHKQSVFRRPLFLSPAL